MVKQEAIAALKACMVEDDENQCAGCPGDDGKLCKYMKCGDPKVYIPYRLIHGILDILENDDSEYKSGMNDARGRCEEDIFELSRRSYCIMGVIMPAISAEPFTIGESVNLPLK